jgi:catechol 2,3-dioxygenase-like lactoylglutathione lyase family enzyme
MFRTVLLATAACATLAAQLPPPNAQGISMGHIHMLVPDPDAHARIWTEVLGARAVQYGSLTLYELPDVVLGFRKGSPTGGTDDSAVNHLGFKTQDLARTKEALVAAGCKIVREMPDTRQFFAMFPDGVKVEFTEDKTISKPIVHHHIHFASHQQDEMRAWYAKMFGAVAGMRGRFKAADLPGVNLSWNPAETPQAPTKGRSMDHIGFEVKGLEAFCKKLEAEGVKFDRPYTKVPSIGLSIAFLTDPWGATIELTEGLRR